MSAFPFNLFKKSSRNSSMESRQSRRRKLSRSRVNVEKLEDRHLMAGVVANFADLTLAPNSHFNGPTSNATDKPDPFGGPLPVKVGNFISGTAKFYNEYNTNYGSWAGFGYSNETDTTTSGFGNQYSSFTGGGHGDANFGVASGYADAATFNPSDATQLAQLPNITLPTGGTISSVYVSNNTYAALSIKNGDSFAKQFGGASGNDPDFFKLTAYGTDAAGNVLPGSASIYLADYRFADNSQDYVLNTWAQFNLTALAGANRVYFNLSSSDVGSFGMNTPSQFVIDDVAFNVPDNHAPVLNAALSPKLNTISEDATNPPGTYVYNLLSGAVTDADPGAVQGIAVTGASYAAKGTWEYSLNDGASWTSLGAVSLSNARLLPATFSTRVRFVPSADFNGEVTLYYVAWDQTQGEIGGTFDLSGGGKVGGTTAFSGMSESAPLKINAVNDAPILGGISGTVGYTQNAASIPLAQTATLTDVDNKNFAGGVLLVRVLTGFNNSNRLEIGGSLFTVNSSNDVLRQGVIIGKLNVGGGVGTTGLQVTFNDNATAGIVQQLIRAIRFRTVGSTSTVARGIEFAVTDGLGGVARQNKTVNVA